MVLSTGEKIKNLRKEKALTQKELSIALGVSVSTIRMVEQDEREPSYKLLDSLAKFFNINKNQIISDDIGNQVVTIKRKEVLTVKQVYEKQIQLGIVSMVKNYYSKYEHLQEVEQILEPLYRKLYEDAFIEELLIQNGYERSDSIPAEVKRAVEEKLEVEYQLFLESFFNIKDY